MKQSLTVIILLLVLHFSMSHSARASSLPVPQLETLPNGMQLAWFLSERLPIVDLAILVKSGSRDDEIGKSGTAELVAATLDRGAGGLDAPKIARSVEMLGASRYATADEDTFSVGMHGLAPDAPTLLELLSKIVLQPEFPKAEVNREQARILDRWNHLADYGDALASHAYKRLISNGTPYGRGSLLSVQEFKQVKRDDVLEFHKKHFVPGNAILMIVGQVNQTEFRNKILSLFGNWSGSRSSKKFQNYSDPRLRGEFGQIIVVNRPNLSQAQVRIGFRAPLINSPDHYSLVVANALLGEYFNSRLNSLIRDKLALTYSIGSSFNYEKDLAYFTVSSSTRNEAVGQLVKKTQDVLKELKAGPIALDEIAMAKEYLGMIMKEERETI
ncbi:MAG: pitrilysin family protein, partial [Bdellovibrionota bacterium]